MSDVVLTYAGNRRRLQPGEVVTIGRGRDNDLMVTDAGASRRHAQIRRDGDTVEVIDLGSSNGTLVDGSHITGPTRAGAGSRIQLGGLEAAPIGIVLEGAAAPGGTPAARSPYPAQPREQLPTHGRNQLPGASHRPISAPMPQRLPATSSVPRVPSHTGVVFDRYSLPSDAMPQRASHTSVQGAIPQVLAASQNAGAGVLTIGRGLENQIIIDDLLASRQHARLVPNGHGFDVQDLDSRNGTYVNGQRVTTGRLGEGDLLAVGHSRFTVRRGQLVASVDEGDVNFVANHISFVLPNGKALLDDISFAMEGSSLLAVVGPSGAGKSTLLKALTGSQPATMGEVYYDGRDLYQNFDDLRHRIGVVPQDDVVHRQLTVRQALRYAAELRFPDDLDKHLRDQRVDEVMAELDLTEHAGTRVDKLSGGQRKRTSVALELLTRPSLLFLDEPTSGLDPGLDKQVMQTLRTLADGGRTVVVITHSVANLGVCDKVLLLAPGGKVAYFGPPGQLLPFFGLSDHADVFTSVARDPEGAKQRFRSSPLEVEQIEAPLSAPRRAAPPLEQPPRQQSIPSQLSTLARRHIHVILADRGYAAFMVLLPVALAAIAMIVPGSTGLKLPEPGVHGQSYAGMLLVVLIIGALFMGTASSVRELVGERAIYTREKAVGLSPAAYLWGKVTIFGILTFLQSTLLVLLVILVKPGPSHAVLLGSPTVELIVVCWLTAFTAMCMGLLMSSFVSTSEQVMPLLVVSIMAQLVFSGGLFNVATRNGLKQIAWLMPSRWGYGAAASTSDLRHVMVGAGGVTLPTADDPLYDHTASKWLLSIGMLVVLALIFAVVTQWRVNRQEAE